MICCVTSQAYAQANTNCPYCNHDPACWEPNDDPSLWWSGQCCRPVSEENCEYADHPSEMPEPSYEVLREIEVDPMAPEYDSAYGGWIEFQGGTITHEMTVTYNAQNRITETGACGSPYYDEKTILEKTLTASLGVGLGVSTKYFNAGASISYDYEIKFGGITCLKRVPARRCRKPCVTRWDVYKRVALAAVPKLTVVLLFADDMEMPVGNTQIQAREKQHSVIWEVNHAKCPE